MEQRTERLPCVGDAIARWLVYLELRGTAPTTRQTYRSLLHDLIESPAPLAELDAHALVLASFRSKSPSTARVLHAALGSFYNYCREEGWTTATMRDIPRPKANVKQHRYLSRDELARIMAAARANERTMLLLLLTGLRVAELCSVRWQDYDGTRLRVLFAKGGKPRTVAVNPALRAALDAEDRSHAQIVTITPAGVRRRLTALGKRACVAGLHPHLFRHSFATHFLIEGGIESKGALKALGGWSNDRMVDHYTRTAIAEVALRRAEELNLTDRLLGES